MTVFVGGVHAVGKTFNLKPACQQLGLRHATASQLIKEQRGANWSASREVTEIADNQRALIKAVKALEEAGEKLVLDGHFALRRAINVHEKIEASIFAHLMVEKVVLLEANSSTIAARLVERGDATWTLEEINAFAQQELENAQVVCQHLGIGLLRLHEPSQSEVRDVLMTLAGVEGN